MARLLNWADSRFPFRPILKAGELETEEWWGAEGLFFLSMIKILTPLIVKYPFAFSNGFIFFLILNRFHKFRMRKKFCLLSMFNSKQSSWRAVIMSDVEFLMLVTCFAMLHSCHLRQRVANVPPVVIYHFSFLFYVFEKSNFGRRRTCWSIISSVRKASWTAQNFEGELTHTFLAG